ncbi:MAG: tight adherence protein [Frankiaceae bacterium]|nr:tight adherence protein [Frankiaceae bacterium]
MTALAVLLALAAYAVLRLGVPARRLRAAAPDAVPPRRPLPVVPLGAAVVAYLAGPRLAVVAFAAAYAGRAARRRHAVATRARAVAESLADLCRATAAELRAGAPPVVALARAAEDAPPELAAHVRRLATHGPAPPAETWAALPGAERLRAVGALWRVGADTGSGLADGLDRLAESFAAEQRQRADLAAQLAGPKASAAVLAALPLCGIALAAMLGARPLHFLMATPPGAACLVAGVALDVAGVLWVRRLTAAASP